MYQTSCLVKKKPQSTTFLNNKHTLRRQPHKNKTKKWRQIFCSIKPVIATIRLRILFFIIFFPVFNPLDVWRVSRLFQPLNLFSFFSFAKQKKQTQKNCETIEMFVPRLFLSPLFCILSFFIFFFFFFFFPSSSKKFGKHTHTHLI